MENDSDENKKNSFSFILQLIFLISFLFLTVKYRLGIWGLLFVFSFIGRKVKKNPVENDKDDEKNENNENDFSALARERMKLIKTLINRENSPYDYNSNQWIDSSDTHSSDEFGDIEDTDEILIFNEDSQYPLDARGYEIRPNHLHNPNYEVSDFQKAYEKTKAKGKDFDPWDVPSEKPPWEL